MAGYGDCQSTDIAASPERCYAALADYEHLPDWQGAVRSVKILERDEQGRGSVVEFEVDAKVKSVRYTLRQVHDEPRRLGCEYVKGDFRNFSGEWRFEPRDGGESTHVVLDLTIDPGRFVPGPLRGAISDAVMRRALKDLKAHLEGQRAPSSTSTSS
jgi:ribosome-associated toxin RatA of RatAB toxin-antitoxin module